jgi:hypothetical protein
MRIDFSQNKNDAFATEALHVPTYPLDEAVKWIQEELTPDEVFTGKQLDTWAFDNGFRKFE